MAANTSSTTMALVRWRPMNVRSPDPGTARMLRRGRSSRPASLTAGTMVAAIAVTAPPLTARVHPGRRVPRSRATGRSRPVTASDHPRTGADRPGTGRGGG